jgi:basic amino acid/polyamine antiporter, APA family
VINCLFFSFDIISLLFNSFFFIHIIQIFFKIFSIFQEIKSYFFNIVFLNYSFIYPNQQILYTQKIFFNLMKEVQDVHKSTAVKKLTQPIILLILIGAILGSSLFYLPSLGVISSGPASIIAWIIVFTIASLIMLYIGELITLHPTSGGTYEFCKRAYGRFGSFLAGWTIWIAGNCGMALGLVAAAQYFLPGDYPGMMLTHLIFVGIWALVLNYMAYRGIDAGTTMLVTFGIISLIVVLVMTIPSFIDVPALFSGKLGVPFKFELMKPFFQHSGLSIYSYLILSVLLISEAFFGFEAVSYMANEAENPRKLHRVLITAIIICGVVMTIYLFSSLGTVSYHDYVTGARPFAVQAFNTMGSVGRTIVEFGLYLVILGSIAAWPITGSRLIRAMAHDKLFLKHFAVLHPEHRSPHRAIYFQTGAALLFSWILLRGYLVGWENPYRTVYLIYVILSLLVLALVVFSVPILRKKEEHLIRAFKAPFARLGPSLFVIFVLGLIVNWVRLEGGTATTILLLSVSFILLGIPFYFFVEMLYNTKSILKVNNFLSYFVLLVEKFFFPITIRNKLLKDVGDVKGKKILEYGCSFGSLTKRLGHKVGSSGRIFALDLAEHKVRIATKRNKHHRHVSIHHHPHLNDFRLQLPHKVDGVLSIGMLSYMQNPQQILNSLGRYVKTGGEIVFLDYDKFFYIIPNVTWMKSDKHLVDLFKNAGFTIEVERRRGLLWQYIIITGTKD